MRRIYLKRKIISEFCKINTWSFEKDTSSKYIAIKIDLHITKLSSTFAQYHDMYHEIKSLLSLKSVKKENNNNNKLSLRTK